MYLLVTSLLVLCHHTELIYVPLVHGVTLSTSIYLCAMYDWHGSDIGSTYVTVLTCTVLQSHSLKQFTYVWLYWQYIHLFHNPVG